MTACQAYSVNGAVNRDALRLFEALRACTYVGWNNTRMNEAHGLERNTRFIDEADEAIRSYYRQQRTI